MLEDVCMAEAPPAAAGVNCNPPGGCESLEDPPAVLPEGWGHPGILP